MASPKPKDWTLLSIAFSRARPLTPVQLQKVLFLLGKQMPAEVGPTFYTFDAYDYGPFCRQVYVDAEELRDEGLISMVTNPRGDWSDYAASQAGIKNASDLAKLAPPKVVDHLAKLVTWVSKQTFLQLVKWVYANYPQYKKNSIFVD